MARPRSTQSQIAALSLDKQIMAQGVQAILATRVQVKPSANAPAQSVLTQEFLNWLHEDRGNELSQLIADFAIQKVAS